MFDSQPALEVSQPVSRLVRPADANDAPIVVGPREQLLHLLELLRRFDAQ